jgi:hypothetical protein
MDDKHGQDPNDFIKGYSKLIDLCIEIDAPCVLREATPQHFIYKTNVSDFDGLYNETKLHNGRFQGCTNDIVKEYHPFARWRNQVIWSIRKNLNVLPIFDALVPRGIY